MIEMARLPSRIISTSSCHASRLIIFFIAKYENTRRLPSVLASNFQIFVETAETKQDEELNEARSFVT
jgi:hypothetical protein